MAEQRTSFLDLPAEIRNVIYEMDLVKPKVIVLSDNVPSLRSSAEQYFHEPALLAVSSKIRHEALPVFYSNNTFQAPFSSAACVFFRQLRTERCKMLREVRAFNFLVLRGTPHQAWLRTVWDSVHRMIKESVACVHRDAPLVPILENGIIVWKHLTEIEEFTVCGDDFEWCLKWACPEA